jgi:hypothetical protein
VVEAVYHELIKIPGDFCDSREKHRLGLRQVGSPFMSIPTVGRMLEIVFDVLEGGLLSTFCALTCCQFCGIWVSSVMFFIATSVKVTSFISRTIPFLQLVLRRTFKSIKRMRPIGRRSCPSASLSTSLARGVLRRCIIGCMIKVTSN